MCGIAGFLLDESLKKKMNDKKSVIYSMLEAIHARGPDDQGDWSDENTSIFLGHKRLSIQDLSNAGHQPMSDKEERYVITFNGEIYNHKELRSYLYRIGHNINWNGSSDTETLVESISKLGLKKTLELSEGMFAFALWDNLKKELKLVRDRFGEKPIYYSYNKYSLTFASELKSIARFPDICKSINRDAIVSLLTYNYIRGPQSIYRNIFKLQPGTILSIRKEDMRIRFESYWNTYESLTGCLNNKLELDSEEMIESIHTELIRSISQQKISDVPIGCFLSGGIDSSLVSAIMQSQESKPIKTFSIGFEEQSFNESQYAKRISKTLGTSHYEKVFTINDALEIIPKLPYIYDEPFSDSSQLANILVSELASSSVKVCLTGDGADEIFHGYPRYINSERISKVIYWLHPSIRIPIRDLVGLLFKNKRIIPKRVDKLLRIVGSNNYLDIYHQFISHWTDVEGIVLLKNNSNSSPQSSYDFESILDKLNSSGTLDNMNKASIYDICAYLTDDILVKVDRASMAFSLETRAPFLNHNLVKMAWKMPNDIRFKNGIQKYALKQILGKYIPPEYFKRPKKGFSVPIEIWLRGALAKWADELLDPVVIQQQGILDSKRVTDTWNDFKSGNSKWYNYIWDILMLQAWLNK